MYQEEDYLMISGLEHFAFCRRQWALIHIEQQWAENTRTVDGAILHEKAHNPDLREKRGELIITRGIKVFSANLGISGECDVLEFRKSDKGISLHGYEGLWQPYPVEYKRGTPATGEGNILQLCAQAMCLEEMLCCEIKEGALFYGEIRRRDTIQFTEELRQQVKDYLKEMHDYYKKGYTPKVKTGKACNACSLKEICVPKLTKAKSVKTYLQKKMEEDA
ncbi:MAG: CRISPR-associated protein Cas4 [Lachnospiraceae bacterium]|nr:CRISPR-associated protein Cas4 [Lachnospiraceae bacterium]